MRMFPRRFITASFGVVALTLVATGCSGASGESAPTGSASSDAGYPVSIENCGRTVTFDAAPENVVSLWQAPTEMLLALGLGDRITAVAGNYGPFPESVADEAASLTVLGSAMAWPSKEVLLSEAPDLVVGQSLEGFAFDTAQGYASVEQIEAAGANVYGANMCVTADALTMTVDTPITSLRDLGKIFGVSERADEIIAQLEAEKQTVIDAVAGQPSAKVAFYNGGEGPLIVLAGGIYDDAISVAGGENAFPSDAIYVSKEEFAASDADVILVGTFEGQDFDTLSAYITATFPDLPAVKNGRLTEIPVADTDASISVMRGLTQIANAIHPDLGLAVPSS